MKKQPWKDFAIGVGRDLAIGIGIGILVAIFVGGSELLFIIVSVIGSVMGGRVSKQWWGAVLGGFAGNLAIYLLVLIYLLLGGAQ